MAIALSSTSDLILIVLSSTFGFRRSADRCNRAVIVHPVARGLQLRGHSVDAGSDTKRAADAYESRRSRPT